MRSPVNRRAPGTCDRLSGCMPVQITSHIPGPDVEPATAQAIARSVAGCREYVKKLGLVGGVHLNCARAKHSDSKFVYLCHNLSPECFAPTA